MAGPASKVTQVVIKEIGKRLTKLAAKKAGSRLVGHMTRSSRAWQKAFRHISLHFRPMGKKASHAVFKKKHRSEAAVKQLIQQAASRPSRAPVTTKLTIGAENIGRPAVIIERRFKQAIGSIGDEACHVLRVVVDYTGRPITAYPVKSFLTSAGGKKAAAAGAAAVVVGGSVRSANAQSPVDLYAELLAAERAERDARSEKVCEPDGVVEWVIDFIVAPSCIAPDPHQLISKNEVNERIKALTTTFAKKSGATLDPATRANIRADVIAAWGMGYRME